MGPNCFNAVQLYFQETKDPAYLAPAEFIKYLAKFEPIPIHEADVFQDVFVVWSRTDNSLPIHAFVLLADDTVFQKLDSTEDSRHEIISREEALRPYRDRSGFQITKHRRVRLRPAY